MGDTKQLLRAAQLFSDLGEDELDAIARLASVRKVMARDVIVRQGDPGGELFVIAEGHLKVVSPHPGGRETALNIMGPGEVFGEVTLIDGAPRSATIVSLDDGELVSIRREPFLGFLSESPKTTVRLLQVLAGRLRRLTERTEDIAFLRVSGRLARRVLKLGEEYGRRLADGSTLITVKLSQQEIGDLVGATRESTNKMLRVWEEDGLISQQSGHLVVHDMKELAERAR
ncbi:MAG: Crp/Fnr family transcriptional regulator [Myxococcales bacterium]|nr:Crp/Fnr family transcriptional regulator [Myxococcales bacterium]